jgi:biopolymer transport protein ExbD
MGAKLGGGGGKGKGMTPNSEPNVIPFIDIMLVLLIIFMVAAPLPTVDVNVDLPPPNPLQAPPEEGKKATFVFLVDEGGVLLYAVDGEQVTLDQLAAKAFDKARLNNPAIDFYSIFKEAKVYVKADQDTAYANVVEVMNKLNQFNKVGIVAEEAQL